MYLSRVTFGLQAELWMDGDRADATGRKLDLCVADSEASPAAIWRKEGSTVYKKCQRLREGMSAVLPYRKMPRFI
jgi:hypothetical protein